MIYFVGAGPGEPELITVKGKRLIESADVILYAGSLVDTGFKKWIKDDCITIDTSSLSLEEIINHLATYHAQGKMIVRLHSGDPSIYSAMQEQLDELDKLGIDYEVVPGVTSGFALASALKMELTIPELTQTVIITRISGRTKGESIEKIIGFIKSNATVLIYLSITHLKELVDRLKEIYPEDFQILIGHRISYPDQMIIKTTLRDSIEEVNRYQIKRQAIILISPALNVVHRARSKLYDKTFSHMFRA